MRIGPASYPNPTTPPLRPSGTGITASRKATFSARTAVTQPYRKDTALPAVDIAREAPTIMRTWAGRCSPLEAAAQVDSAGLAEAEHDGERWILLVGQRTLTFASRHRQTPNH